MKDTWYVYHILISNMTLSGIISFLFIVTNNGDMPYDCMAIR